MSGRHGMNYCLLIITLFWHLSACIAQEQSPSQEPVFQPEYDLGLDKGSHGSYPVREFHSSKTKIPHVNFLKWTPECATRNDFYFITPKGWKVSNPGPMILDYRGDLVWAEHFDNEFGGQAYDLMVQEYLGEKFLTFWLGDDRIRGHGAGHFHMVSPYSNYLMCGGFDYLECPTSMCTELTNFRSTLHTTPSIELVPATVVQRIFTSFDSRLKARR
jgi:hypothetical protein